MIEGMEEWRIDGMEDCPEGMASPKDNRFVSCPKDFFEEFRSRNFSFEVISLTKNIIILFISTIIIIFLLKEENLSRRSGGMIIEPYPDDPRGASCLILGFTEKVRPLHIVCGRLEDEEILIITAYEPDSIEWESDLKTRKKGVQQC